MNFYTSITLRFQLRFIHQIYLGDTEPAALHHDLAPHYHNRLSKRVRTQ